MKHIKLFNTHAEYLVFTESDKYVEPHVSLTEDDGIIHYNKVPAPEMQPFDEIWYTTVNGEMLDIVDDDYTAVFSSMDYNGDIWASELRLLSNTYENGRGILKFNGNIVSVGDNDWDSPFWWGDVNLKTMTFPESVIALGDDIFDGCENLESFNIPESTIYLGVSLLNGQNVSSVYIPKNVQYIGWIGTEYNQWNYTYSAYDYFISNYELPLVSIKVDPTNPYFTDYDSNVVVDKRNNALIGGCNTSIIPNGIEIIGSGSFMYTTISSLTIPDSVTSIGDSAFYDCDSLTSVTIPDSVTEICLGAFQDCSSLTNLIYADGCTTVLRTYATNITSVTIPDSVTSIGGSAFYNCSSLTSIVIPDSVTSIGSQAFYNCSSLTSIVIPNSVTEIGNSAFRNCTSLTSIVIPDSVTSIGIWGFRDCTSLTSVTIPDSVTSIGDQTFNNCRHLTSVAIPDSVTYIGNGAFYNCMSLTSITYTGTKSQWNAISKKNNWKDNVPSTCIVHCTDGDVAI